MKCYVCGGRAVFAAVVLSQCDDAPESLELKALPFCVFHEDQAYQAACDLRVFSDGPEDEPLKIGVPDLFDALDQASEVVGVPALVLMTA